MDQLSICMLDMGTLRIGFVVQCQFVIDIEKTLMLIPGRGDMVPRFALIHIWRTSSSPSARMGLIASKISGIDRCISGPATAGSLLKRKRFSSIQGAVVFMHFRES